mgnify:FL=1|jgi:adenine-specific DNA-methyltransferase
MNLNNIYGTRTKGGQQGDVYTLPYVVSFMLDEVGYTADRDLSAVTIFEPSCGEGEFVIEIVSRLYLSSVKYGFDFETVFKENVFASDIDEKKMKVCIERISSRYNLTNDSFSHFFVEDFLLSHHPCVDIVVGNPPYIRYEAIPEDAMSRYKSIFHCFYYRADIYVLFFEKTLSMLKRGGRHCFICSNRWMKNTYGIKLRNMIASSFRLEKIFDMEAIRAFQEDVLAYPSITLITNQRATPRVEFYKIEAPNEIGKKAPAILQMPFDGDWSSMFTKQVFANFLTIQEQGFCIGIGVATGCDSIFISKNFKGNIEEDLLLPCINAQNLKGNQLNWDGRYLLNPYNCDGSLVDLSLYPKAKAYLQLHYDRLSKRHKARKKPQRWYATIDSIDKKLLTKPKVLLPDISGNSFIFVDEGKYYPQHNIYYITGGTVREMKILAALLMSSAIKEQLGDITNHMNGGYARWQSQYLKKLRLPVVAEISHHDRQVLLENYDNCNQKGIDAIVSHIIDTQRKTKIVTKTKKKAIELTLNFDYI